MSITAATAPANAKGTMPPSAIFVRHAPNNGKSKLNRPIKTATDQMRDTPGSAHFTTKNATDVTAMAPVTATP